MKRLVFASACILTGFGLGSLTPVGRALAALVTPAAINGCTYLASPPTLADRQTIKFQCDVNGRLLVH